jgi:hypothetical protein
MDYDGILERAVCTGIVTEKCACYIQTWQPCGGRGISYDAKAWRRFSAADFLLDIFFAYDT